MGANCSTIISSLAGYYNIRDLTPSGDPHACRWNDWRWRGWASSTRPEKSRYVSVSVECLSLSLSLSLYLFVCVSARMKREFHQIDPMLPNVKGARRRLEYGGDKKANKEGKMQT